MRATDDDKNPLPESAGSPVTRSRRRLVGLLAAGGAGSMLLSLPDAWKRPVVESVVLPAHGQTTAPPDTPPDLSDGTFALFGEAIVRAPDHRILDYFASTAHAGQIAQINTVTGCLELVDGRLRGDIEFLLDTADCLAEYDPPGGAPLGGSANADSIIGALTENDALCATELSPATLEFLSMTGTAPNRVARVRLTTSEGSEVFDCPEGCEG